MLRPFAHPRRVLTASVLAAALAFTAACGGGSGDSADEGSGEQITSIVTGWPIDLATMDPAKASNDQDKELTLNVYERLLEYAWTEDEDGSLIWDGLGNEPALASSYVAEGTSVTFTLRDGATFYPTGNPLTAEDVRWSYERALALGGGDYRNGGLLKPEQAVVVDDKTITFNFTDNAGNPVPATDTLLATFRMPTGGIVDSVEARKHATADDPYASVWLTSNAVGTGPYYVKSRTIGQEIELAPVPTHWKDEPKITSVTIRILQNGNVASLLRGGEINLALFGLTPKDVTDLGDLGYQAMHIDTPDFIFMQLAEGTGPFADQAVRQAVAYAIPYDDLVNDVYFGLAERSLSYVNVKAPGFSPAWEQYTTDLDKAKDLMEDAGSPTFDVTFRYNSAEPAYEDMAILIQSNLKEIGINVTLVPMLKAQLTQAIRDRALAAPGAQTEDAMVMNNLSVYIDDPKSPVSFYTKTGAASNYMRYSSAEVDNLANRYQFAEQSDDRVAAYERIQEIVADDAGFIPLVRTGRNVVMDPNLTGASFTPEIGTRFWTLHSK